MEDIKNKILGLARLVADEQGVEVIDAELLGRGKLLLRVTIDKEGGVSLDDCERFSRSLESLLDVEDLIPGRYTLEVSSPGLDRPLKRLKDFEKSIGKLVRIVTTEKIENQNFFVGRVLSVSDGQVKLLVNSQEIEIPIDRISTARLEVELR
ncbi:MAG: ribosome maturation factor RimP [Nitrospirota bacterium]